MILAEMDTGSFHFVALAIDEAHARRLLTRAWNRHAREFGASWSAADVMEGANFHPIEVGTVLRDGDVC